MNITSRLENWFRIRSSTYGGQWFSERLEYSFYILEGYQQQHYGFDGQSKGVVAFIRYPVFQFKTTALNGEESPISGSSTRKHRCEFQADFRLNTVESVPSSTNNGDS